MKSNFAFLFFGLLLYSCSTTENNATNSAPYDSTQVRINNYSAVSSQISMYYPEMRFDSVEQFESTAYKFAGWVSAIAMANNVSSGGIPTDIRETAYKLQQIQINEFPRLRKEFKNFSDARLWKIDVRVKISGQNNDILTLSGANFYSMNNIFENQKSLLHILYLLRFKEIRYNTNSK